MKRSTILIVLLLILPSIIKAQDETEKLSLNWSGFVGYDFFFDTYESATTRDGEVYLYPNAELLDKNGDDINKNFQSQMLAIHSRARLTASGLSAFGAKATGVIEGDFLGTAPAYTRLFRLRHAFINLKWDKAELLTGQTWHPMFVTGCFPGVISFGAGAPFHPLNRAPQVRFTYMPTSNLDFMGALLYHGDFRSSGPSDALQNSGIPEMQFQFRFHNDNIFAGFTAGYKILQPRTVTDTLKVKTNKTIGSYNLQAFLKVTTKPITIKLEGIYGENLTNFVMIGGYGATSDPTLVDDYDYVNLKTISLWTDIHTNFKKVNFGLFAGYSANMGASEEYHSLSTPTLLYARGESLDYIYRISPRLMFTSGKFTFAVEHMMTGAAYGTAFDTKQKVSQTADATINHRVLLSTVYKF